MAKVIELETRRLRLRQWRTADREPFAALNSDCRVMEFSPTGMQWLATTLPVPRIARNSIHREHLTVRYGDTSSMTIFCRYEKLSITAIG